jgi:cyclic beta-1,2-glucan synthetase
VELAPEDSIEVVFLLGEAADVADAQHLVAKYRVADLDEVYRQVTA